MSNSPLSSRAQAGVLLGSLSLLSAFLLFQVQPVISKFILPWFGGSPGVWTTCMVFFQVLLFAGYAYAHVLTRLRPRAQAVLHSALLLGAAVCLPISPDEVWKPEGGEDPSARILLLLAATVGLPYFVLSSTSPLAQVWFTRAVPGGLPWRLYALSNIGSLAALLTYPFVIEPRMEVMTQTRVWSVAFVFFAALSLWLAWRNGRVPESAPAPAAETAEEETRESQGLRLARALWNSAGRRLLWVLLPALASVLLLAATNHVCQDVAVVPFMWVVPLSLYLLTFIICFEHERWYARPLWAVLAAAAVVAALCYDSVDSNWSFKPFEWVWWEAPWKGRVWTIPFGAWMNYRVEVTVCFGAMFLTCMVCHGELARLKPEPARLTEFYLLMSAGGALGGLAVSLGAPRVFVTYLEWPLGLLAGLGLAALALAGAFLSLRRLWLGAPLALAVLGAGGWGVYELASDKLRVEPRVERVRNFYGTIYIDKDWDTGLENDYVTLVHGGIIHGMQNLGADYRQEPVTYYGHHTGIGRALDSIKARPGARVGIVGLGSGTAACYAQQGQAWRFYEINPEIVRLAEKHFTYLADARTRGAEVSIHTGDARLTLEREEAQKFDVLLLDAFSGDAIPMHLLTREAFDIYARHMAPEGIIVVHVTNSYLTLAPVVERQAEALGWGVTRIMTQSEGDHDSTDYVMVTKNAQFLKDTPVEEPEDPEPEGIPLWTDRYHNLFQILMKE
ncbi:MAG TPA: fused MFS/spermidine synthase [Prosthecobacter sp.]|nr:fused MFS/spermidine synthase [Prosthecobacter sp.]